MEKKHPFDAPASRQLADCSIGVILLVLVLAGPIGWLVILILGSLIILNEGTK